MDSNVFEVVRLAVMLLATVLSVWVMPALRQLIKQNVSSKGLQDAYKIAQIVVLAVQQTMGEQPGEERKAEAMQMLTDILVEMGIILTTDQMSTLVESAVKQMKMGTA